MLEVEMTEPVATPNLDAIVQNCVSGQHTEWPAIRAEVLKLKDALTAERERAEKAEADASKWRADYMAESGDHAETIASAKYEIAHLEAALARVREALKNLHDAVDDYFGPSKAGSAYPKYFDYVMSDARTVLAADKGAEHE
jgi:hypothetical protein